MQVETQHMDQRTFQMLSLKNPLLTERMYLNNSGRSVYQTTLPIMVWGALLLKALEDLQDMNTDKPFFSRERPSPGYSFQTHHSPKPKNASSHISLSRETTWQWRRKRHLRCCHGSSQFRSRVIWDESHFLLFLFSSSDSPWHLAYEARQQLCDIVSVFYLFFIFFCLNLLLRGNVSRHIQDSCRG